MPETRSKITTTRLWAALALVTAVTGLVFWTARQDSVSPENPNAPATGTAHPVASAPTVSSAVLRKVKGAALTAHVSDPAPLPPPGTPLARIFDKLKARADSGDGAAAARLYHDVHRCLVSRDYRRLLAEASVFNSGDANASVGFVRHDQVSVKQRHEMSDYVESNSTRCDGASAAQLDAITPLLLQAAQLGDLKALDCYVGSDISDMGGLLDHPEWLDQYRKQVPDLVESALQRGDWVVVDLLHHAYSGAFSDSFRGQVFGADALMDFRLLSLERLGATDRFAAKLDPMLTAAAKQLPPAQVADAQSWALDQYSRYFNSSSNEVWNGANICQIDNDQTT